LVNYDNPLSFNGMLTGYGDTVDVSTIPGGAGCPKNSTVFGGFTYLLMGC
jgi:hypothetical protein